MNDSPAQIRDRIAKERQANIDKALREDRRPTPSTHPAIVREAAWKAGLRGKPHER
jgi:hypothetical protein